MDTYTITINGCDYEVQIIEDMGTSARVTVNGVAYNVQVRNSHSPDSVVVESLSSRNEPSPEKRPSPVTPNPGPANPAPKASSEPGIIAAPMPGVVLEITVTVGQKVKRGDVVVRIEAMKMENDIFAPVDGTIKEIKVQKGTQVQEHDVLIVLGE